MAIKPVLEDDAADDVKDCYVKIKHALNLPKVPLFFAYLGSFPLYLKHITNQLVINLSDPSFKAIIDETSGNIMNQIQNRLAKSEEINSWLLLYSRSPSFYNFQIDLKNVFQTNLKLAFIFICLREALKGWAIAAKKLPNPSQIHKNIYKSEKDEEEDFIFENMLGNSSPIGNSSSQMLSTVAPHALEKDMLPEYLFLCRRDFLQILKKSDFWFLRIDAEKKILSELAILPQLIFSPINVILRLIGQRGDYPDLLYLLSEHFPTYAIQRMMFSGYITAPSLI